MDNEVGFLLGLFDYEHLPPLLGAISKPFGELAQTVADGPRNPMTIVAMHRLLEAKDAAVRAEVAAGAD